MYKLPPFPPNFAAGKAWGILLVTFGTDSVRPDITGADGPAASKSTAATLVRANFSAPRSRLSEVTPMPISLETNFLRFICFLSGGRISAGKC